MASSVVLVTGVSHRLGHRLAGDLAADPAVGRVIGVDTVPPEGLEGVDFVRADIRNPLIAKVITSSRVDTVVHLSIASAPSRRGGRAAMKEMNVIGTMQLLAACQKAECLQRLVVRSTSAIYGASPRDPAVFCEESEPPSAPRSGYAKDAVEIEGYVRGFRRRRPDVAVGLLRFANIVGAVTESPLARYFAFPAVPTVLGFDPRLQFLHEDDAVEALRRAVRHPDPGTINVAAAGILTLSQAIRRAGRLPVPVPVPMVPVVARSLRSAGLLEAAPGRHRFVEFGRIVDTTRMRTRLDLRPGRTSAEAFADFVRTLPLRPVVDPAAVDTCGRKITDLLQGGGLSHG